MLYTSISRRFFTLSSLLAVLLVEATGCGADPSEESAQGPAEEAVSEAQDALRTSGSLAKYFHVSTSQVISQEAEYSSWSARWHTVMRGRVDNELFFYDRIDGTSKVYSIADDGTLTLKHTETLIAGVDVWVRGNFYGTSEKEIASYDRSSGMIRVYEVLSSGDIVWRFTKTADVGYSLAFSGHWGAGGYDDVVLYDRGTGSAKYYQSTGAALGLAHSAAWQKVWDYIVPGKFNTDGNTDLLYYNQDSGEAKVFTMDSSRTGTLTYQTTSWPMTPYSVVVAGEFGGSTQTDDVLVYDPRDGWDPATGQSAASGRGTFYTSSTSGVLSKGNEYTNWQKKWTHITALKQPSRSTHDLMFYSDAYDIHVSAVRVADTGGGNAAMLSACDVNRWLDVANDTYRGAGVRFVWDGTFYTLNNTAINAYACDSSDSDSLKNTMDSKAINNYGAPGKLVVYFRTQGGGDGCGSPSRQYLVMPDFTGTGTTYYMRDGSVGDAGNCPGTSASAPNNIKLFAHEVGHYLGLGHTYWDGADSGLPSSYDAMDVDSSGGTWSSVLDTSPTPHGDYWFGDDPNYPAGSSELMCDDSPSGEITYPLSGGGSLTLNPDRHNVMLNGVNCDFTYNLTPGQIDAVRENLFNNRVELTTEP